MNKPNSVGLEGTLTGRGRHRIHGRVVSIAGSAAGLLRMRARIGRGRRRIGDCPFSRIRTAAHPPAADHPTGTKNGAPDYSVHQPICVVCFVPSGAVRFSRSLGAVQPSSRHAPRSRIGSGSPAPHPRPTSSAGRCSARGLERCRRALDGCPSAVACAPFSLGSAPARFLPQRVASRRPPLQWSPPPSKRAPQSRAPACSLLFSMSPPRCPRTSRLQSPSEQWC